MRKKYYINGAWMKNVDFEELFLILLKYTTKKAKYMRTELEPTQEKIELNKKIAEKLIGNYLKAEIQNLELFDSEGPILESYDYATEFGLRLNEEEYRELMEVFIKNNIPEKIIFAEDDLRLVREIGYGMIATPKTKIPKFIASNQKKQKKKTKN